ncbi:MAG: PsiF family protein [Methylocella sp.]
MKSSFSWILAGALLLSCAQVTYAQTQAPAAKTPAATTKTDSVSDDAKKAKAKECSNQADAKGLHGKARKEFRSKCKRM